MGILSKSNYYERRDMLLKRKRKHLEQTVKLHLNADYWQILLRQPRLDKDDNLKLQNK